jgi:hypothetical protein
MKKAAALMVSVVPHGRMRERLDRTFTKVNELDITGMLMDVHVVLDWFDQVLGHAWL